jgi:hypothetical protein
MRIRITLMRIRFFFQWDPDPAFYFNADPNPAFHFNADPNPSFHFHAGGPDPDPPVHFKPPCFHCERPRLYFEPL